MRTFKEALDLQREFDPEANLATFYMDDGELQDTRYFPCIDYRRDSYMEIARALIAREITKK